MMQEYKPGSIFNIWGELYILAIINKYEVNLICLHDGIRWYEPIRHEGKNPVPEDKLLILTNGKPFAYVGRWDDPQALVDFLVANKI